jgi:hypothetical protein
LPVFFIAETDQKNSYSKMRFMCKGIKEMQKERHMPLFGLKSREIQAEI